jgi:hypothetical protein
MRKERIAAFAGSKDYVPMTKENMAILLCVPKSDLAEFSAIIDELIDEGATEEEATNFICCMLSDDHIKE